MFQASLCPSLGEQDRELPHMVFCTGCAVCGLVELRREPCALCESYWNSNFHIVHTACDPAPHNHSQHSQCRTPYAVIHGLVLLMMGIMIPETCWDRSLIINIWLVASCWFLSLHPTFVIHGHKSPNFVFYMFRISYVHLQEDYIIHAVLYGIFFMHLCRQSSVLKDVLDTSTC